MTSKAMNAEEPQDNSPEEEEDLHYFIRIDQTDLDGTKTIERSLMGMEGIGERTARIITDATEVDRTALFGKFPEGEIDAVVNVVENFEDHTPEWMASRRKDSFSGDTGRITGSDLEEKWRYGINRIEMISPHGGIQHQHSQKVRGQQTKSTGRTEGTIGVSVEKTKEARAEK